MASSTTVGGADYYCDATADDVQIQAALDALPAGGGRVVLREGTFNLAAAVNMLKSNVTLEGQGTSTKIFLTNATNTNCIKMGDGASNYSNITVKNLLIDGNMANQSSNGHGIEIKTLVDHPTVTDCTIQNTYKGNIFDAGSTYAIIRNNNLTTTRVGSQWSNIEGIGNYALITNNRLINGDWAAVSIYNGINVWVTNNYLTGSPRAGIEDTLGQNFIQDNFCYIPSNSSLPIISCLSSSKICGNTIFVTNAVTAAITAIKIGNWGSQAVDNYIYFATLSYAHIGIYSTSGDVQLNNNFIINRSESPSGAGAIGIKAQSVNQVLTGNYINSFDTAIDIQTANNTIISGGFIYNGTLGIDVSETIHITITGVIIDGPANGISSTGTSFTRQLNITNNNFGVITNESILLSSTKYSTISNNVIGSGAGILIKTVSGTNYSTHNVLTGNTIQSSGTYGIREDSANDGPNIVTSNIVTGQSTPISTQNGSSVSANNIIV